MPPTAQWRHQNLSIFGDGSADWTALCRNYDHYPPFYLYRVKEVGLMNINKLLKKTVIFFNKLLCYYQRKSVQMFEISDQTVNNTNSRSEKWRQFWLRPPPGFASILLNIWTALCQNYDHYPPFYLYRVKEVGLMNMYEFVIYMYIQCTCMLNTDGLKHKFTYFS
jgi:hypothetical protein